jgi:hypothetical protein
MELRKIPEPGPEERDRGHAHALPMGPGAADGRLREADTADIAALMENDVAYRTALNFATLRSRENWEYMFGPGKKTEYGSDFYVVEGVGDAAYFRISREGFGDGLIVSELSWDIRAATLDALLPRLRAIAIERSKPYIRFNLPPESRPGRMLIARGAHHSHSWAWQMKIPDLRHYLAAMGPVLESRLSTSEKSGFSGIYRIGDFRTAVDLEFRAGNLIDVRDGKGEAEHELSISPETLPALLTGAKDLAEIMAFRPDALYSSPVAKRMTEALFPGWFPGYICPIEPLTTKVHLPTRRAPWRMLRRNFS